MKKTVKRLLIFAVSGLLLAYAVKDVAFAQIQEEFQRVNYWWITVVGFLTLLSYLLRGFRWQQPLYALGHRPTVFRATVAIQTGSVASMIVIGSGEITRCMTLQRTDDIPLAEGIGSVVAERIIDLFMLAILLLLTIGLEFTRMQHYLTSLTFESSSLYIGLGFVGLLLLAGWLVSWLLTNAALQQHPFVQRVKNLLASFKAGFLAIRYLPNPGLFIALTILNQFIAWLVIYVSLQAVAATRDLPPTAALTILAVSSLGGIAVPTQGGIGTYHFLVSRALVLYGFATPTGAVIATFLHSISFGLNLLLSGLSFLILPVLIQRKHAPTAHNSTKPTPQT